MEDLEHALKEYNITDEKTIKEIIIEVDRDFSLYDISIYNSSVCENFLFGQQGKI
ncbi:hypothetical protein RDI58_001793 [Solanum bulbocastanum]|uniref:Uncharacterized protein n=1 Tax=Solanum bulbocastanum TaxID=147425 RepID=A0AAN8U5P8_SOLBU